MTCFLPQVKPRSVRHRTLRLALEKKPNNFTADGGVLADSRFALQWCLRERGLTEMNMSELLTTLTGMVSAVAVVISLLLLKRQLQQADKNQRALIQQGRAGRSVDIAMRLMDSNFAEAYHRCMEGDTDVSTTQLVQFVGYCRAVFLGAEDSFLQHRDRLLDELAFNSFKRSLLGLFVSPGMRAAWSVLRGWYDPEFAAYVDSIIKDTTDQPNGFQYEQWKAQLTTAYEPRNAA